MESKDIRLPVCIKPSWRKMRKEAKICLPLYDIEKIKRELLVLTESASQNLDHFDFALQYLGHERPLAHEDDFYVALNGMNEEIDKTIVINVRETQKPPVRAPAALPTELKPKKANVNKENIKNEGLYEGDEKVNCAFCRTSSSVKSAIKDLGPFYGPFTHKDKCFYVHELCAVWSPNVYRDPKTNKFMNLAEEIKRCNKINCNHCGKSGGGLGCSKKSCKRTYHFKCAIKDDVECRIDDDEFTLLCPEHAKEEDNKACEICNKADDDDKMILCDKCPKGFHLYCLKPALSSVPEGDWFCPGCVIKAHGSKSEPKTQHSLPVST